MADGPVNDAPYRVIAEVDFGDGVIVHPFANLYGCSIGDGTRVGPFVEIQRGAVVGARCKIQSHSFLCEGVELADEVFVGHGVLFTNDRRPRATDDGAREELTRRLEGILAAQDAYGRLSRLLGPAEPVPQPVDDEQIEEEGKVSP